MMLVLYGLSVQVLESEKVSIVDECDNQRLRSNMLSKEKTLF